MTKLLVNIDVDDLAAGIRFYTDALPLRVGRRLGGDMVELVGAEISIYLLANRSGTTAVPGSSQLRDYRRHWTPVHLDFAVENLEEAVARAESAGGKREGAVTDHAYGRMALFSDPFGHGFCLLEFKGGGYDAIATGE